MLPDGFVTASEWCTKEGRAAMKRALWLVGMGALGVVGGGGSEDLAKTSAQGGSAQAGADQGSLIEALPEGNLKAAVHATREVIRVPAEGAAASDSETTLKPGTDGSVTSHRWMVVRSETGQVMATFDTREPTFSCQAGGRGTYDVRLVISDGQVQSEYRHRRLITCTLPRVTAGRPEFIINVTSNGGYYPEGKIGGSVVPPGAIVRIRGTATGSLGLLNFQGTTDKPIHIINDGLVTIDITSNASATILLHLVNCQHIVVDGLGDGASPYGFILRNKKQIGEPAVFVRNYTEGASISAPLTDIELFGIRVDDARGSGMNVNTRGSSEYNRNTWTARHLLIHHNLIEGAHDEGLYIGYTRDWVGVCRPA
jgi:hypothetical protein